MRVLKLAIVSVVLTCLTSVSVLASPLASELARVLKLEEVISILHGEGMSYADSIERELMPGGGGDLWDRSVLSLYDQPSMHDLLVDTLSRDMTEEQIVSTLSFFDTEQGQTILTYENAARAAMADPDIEDIARLTYTDARDNDDARLAQIDRFVSANDLMERNVAGALSSNYQFYRGLVDGGAMIMSESDMLADVYGQEPELRQDTEEWLYGFLFMAYQPLSGEAMEDYIVFSETEAGRALNAALFEGFERMYRDISFGLGLAASRSMTGSDL